MNRPVLLDTLSAPEALHKFTITLSNPLNAMSIQVYDHDCIDVMIMRSQYLWQDTIVARFV